MVSIIVPLVVLHFLFPYHARARTMTIITIAPAVCVFGSRATPGMHAFPRQGVPASMLPKDNYSPACEATARADMTMEAIVTHFRYGKFHNGLTKFGAVTRTTVGKSA